MLIDFIKKMLAKPQPPFEWRMRGGEMITVKKMETRHLVNTVCMIWNHAMPQDAKTHSYKQYRFDPALYPHSYIQDAIRAMLPEVMTRTDMTPQEKVKIDKMISYLFKQQQVTGEHAKLDAAVYQSGQDKMLEESYL